MKRFYLICMAALFSLVLLCACGGKGESSQPSVRADAVVETAQPTYHTPSVSEQQSFLLLLQDEWKRTDSYGFPWYYSFNDLDRNGRLEVLTSTLQGTGLYTYFDLYEINADFTGIDHIVFPSEEGGSLPDLTVDSCPCYHDKETDSYWYVFDDSIRNGAAELWNTRSALCLKDGALSSQVISSCYLVQTNGGTETRTTYYDAEGAEITEEDYLRAEKRLFKGMDKAEVSLVWETVMPDPEQEEAALAAAPSDGGIFITKQPRGETVEAGGDTWFIVSAENADSLEWMTMDPNGIRYTLAEAMERNSGLELEDLGDGTLALRHIPASFAEWGIYGEFFNSEGSLATDPAFIHIREAEE